ncbi:dihydrodipicolinate synthase family protein [Cohaesibacter celericrescens]|uniref:dihydrodipicolinate synthase family protein n=1 Tax=Cohaesibacter celericrescens TaxID=2067669 RepID=UPI003567B71F
MVKWQGVFPAVTTKFNDDMSLDYAGNVSHIAWQIDNGVDGVVVCGSLGEASTLEVDEKVQIVKAAKEASQDRIPVIATVSETATQRGLSFVDKAQKAGADGFMVLPGTLYHADSREAVAHYQTIADASDKPILIYNNPVGYRVDLGESELAELAKDPKFQAIKESSDDIRRTTTLRNRFGNRFSLMMGVDNLALESLMMGADGWIAGLVDAFPAETVAIYKLAKAGRWDEAREIYRWFVPLLELDVSTKLVQNIKLAGLVVGRCNDVVRMPRMPLAGADRDKVVGIVENAIASRPTLPTDI